MSRDAAEARQVYERYMELVKERLDALDRLTKTREALKPAQGECIRLRQSETADINLLNDNWKKLEELNKHHGLDPCHG